jgi:hypothetical protein
MDLTSLGGVGKAIARVEKSIALDVVSREALAIESPDVSGKQILQELLGAGIAFLDGSPVKFEVDTKGAPLEFTAHDELGIEYKFTVNGALSIVGTPQ